MTAADATSPETEEPGERAVPLVSVCMPVSRPADVVRRALASVLAQDLADIEVLDRRRDRRRARPWSPSWRIRGSLYHRNPERLGFSRNHCALLDRAPGQVPGDLSRRRPLGAVLSVVDGGRARGAIPSSAWSAVAQSWTRTVAGPTPWPVPIAAGRHDDVFDTLLHEEWFLLPISTMWRRDTWTGAARQWPELCCGDLQFFVSVAEAGWPLYYLPRPLVALGPAQRADRGAARIRPRPRRRRRRAGVLGRMAGDAPAGEDRPRERPAGARHLRRARALLLTGRRAEARRVTDAGGGSGANAGDRRRGAAGAAAAFRWRRACPIRVLRAGGGRRNVSRTGSLTGLLGAWSV